MYLYVLVYFTYNILLADLNGMGNMLVDDVRTINNAFIWFVPAESPSLCATGGRQTVYLNDLTIIKHSENTTIVGGSTERIDKQIEPPPNTQDNLYGTIYMLKDILKTKTGAINITNSQNSNITNSQNINFMGTFQLVYLL